MQRQRQRRLDAFARQALEHATIADGGEHQVLVRDIRRSAEQIDRFEHVVDIVRRLAHAHEGDLLHRAAGTGQHHLGDDLGTTELAQQAIAAGHAEAATHRTADLGRDADAVLRQQHALHRLAIAEFYQQARGSVIAEMFRTHPRHAVELRRQAGQGRADTQGEEILRRHRPAVERQRTRPCPQDALFVTRQGAVATQPLANVFDAHGCHRTSRAAILSASNCTQSVRGWSAMI